MSILSTIDHRKTLYFSFELTLDILSFSASDLFDNFFILIIKINWKAFAMNWMDNTTNLLIYFLITQVSELSVRLIWEYIDLISWISFIKINQRSMMELMDDLWFGSNPTIRDLHLKLQRIKIQLKISRNNIPKKRLNYNNMIITLSS